MSGQFRHISSLIVKIFNLSTSPLQKYSESLITRFPCSRLFFRPLRIFDFYMASGLWEPYFKHVFSPQKGDIVIDVGAYIGYYTLRAAKAVGRSGLVVSVEPDPRNFRILEKNVSYGGLRNVKMLNCALSSYNGYADFQFAKQPHISQLTTGETERVVKVETKTMDRICEDAGIQKVDWLKVDVEGAAYDVLVGGLETLKKGVRMIIEVPDTKTLDLLERLGYCVMPLMLTDPIRGNYYAEKRKTGIEAET